MTAAMSQTAQPIGSFRAWNAYTFSDSDGKSCYIASQPESSKYSQDISGRDPAFFLITTRVSSDPAKTVRNEASTIIGYPFAPDSNVTVDVDGQKFTTLKGTYEELAAAFQKLIDDYVASRYPRR